MDKQQQNQQSISDDQELAKVLAGVSQQADDNSVQYEDPAVLPTVQAATDAATAAAESEASAETPEKPDEKTTPAKTAKSPAGGSLDGIKQEAIVELRPLVDKLDIPADEKFDTYLLLLRSTDDSSLIAPAHEAAQAIPDETKKAQALLDIIKEIDFFSQSQAK